MTVLRDLWTLVADLPDRFARWCDRQVLAAHRAEPVPADDLSQWPNGERPWCLRCSAAWPCDPYAEATDRLTGGSS